MVVVYSFPVIYLLTQFSDEMDVNPLDIFLAATHITTVNVRFPPTAIKSTLEPLPEDEEESYCSDNSSSTTNKYLTQDEVGKNYWMFIFTS